MNELFELVYSLLDWLSHWTGFSYEAINIILYYFITPFVYAYFLDRIFQTKYFRLVQVSISLSIILFTNSFERFSQKLFIMFRVCRSFKNPDSPVWSLNSQYSSISNYIQYILLNSFIFRQI